jgi:hypothetical protein
VLHHDDDRLPRRPPPHINLQHHPCRASLPPRNDFPVPRGRGTESRRTTASPSLKRRCPETLAHILSTHPAGGGEDGRSGSHRRRATSRLRHSSTGRRSAPSISMASGQGRCSSMPSTRSTTTTPVASTSRSYSGRSSNPPPHHILPKVAWLILPPPLTAGPALIYIYDFFLRTNLYIWIQEIICFWGRAIYEICTGLWYLSKLDGYSYLVEYTDGRD